MSTLAISYLSFELGEEMFAVHSYNVERILETTNIKKVPRSPCYMKGVINMDGIVLPIIDTRKVFGMPSVERTSNTCIIILNILIDRETIQIGAIVDSVQAVLEIENKQIIPTPDIGSRYMNEFIKGMANIDNTFVMLLNIDAIISSISISLILDSSAKAKGLELIEDGIVV